MTRQQLEHILRASAAITGAEEFVVIGSQSILGAFPTAPEKLRESMEADIFTFRSPNDADLIDGSIGEQSPFHETFGYHAHGVGPETAVLPNGWRDRVVPVSGPGTNGAVGLCLDPHDLAVAKLVAGREKDIDFVRTLISTSMVNPDTISSRLAETTLPDTLRIACVARLNAAK
jgi:hypothetical protein